MPRLVASACSCFAIALVLLCGKAPAQQSVTSATVAGIIVDPAGGALKGVAVALTSAGTNQRLEISTDRQGRYAFLRVPPGAYVLRAEADQFSAAEVRLTASGGQAIDIPITMRIAGGSETVEVTAEAPSVEAARTQTGGTIATASIDSLPLNGRNYMDLALLVPGVSRTNTGAPQQFAETSAVPGTGLSVSGQRNLDNSFVVDGLSSNDDAAGLAGTFYSEEVIREFQVITAGANAEYGRASSGTISVTTRTGTNDFHGRAYGFFRNQRLDARNPLAAERYPLTQTQFGATLAGPLIRNRTFFFSNFEQSHRQAAGIVTISPASVAVINTTLDTFGYGGPRVTTGEFPTGWHTTNYFARADHQINATNQLSARYSLYSIDSPNSRSVGSLSDISRGTGLANRDQTFAITEAATISPRTLNEFRAQWTRNRLTAPPNDPVGPAVTISGVASFGTSTSSPTRRDNDVIEIGDAWTHQAGAHLIKAGAGFLYNRLTIGFPGSVIAPVYSFGSLTAFQAGRYSTFQQAFGEPDQFQTNPNLALFAQDEWRFARNWTANIGFRYDVQFLADPVNTRLGNLSPRFGLAWSPSDHKTAVRASYGMYYDRIPLRAMSNALQRDGTKYRVALLAFAQPGAPAFPSRLPTFPENQYVNITTIDPNVGNSYSHQSSVEVERELARGTSLTVGYEWVRALHLILSRNTNVPALPAAAANAQGIPNLGRPDSRYGNVSRYESSGDSYYNGLLVSLRSRIGRVGQVRLAYTLSKAIDDVGNFFFSTPQDNSNLRDDRALSDNDQRHRINESAILESPVGHGTTLMRALASGWQLSPMFTYTSALPFNVLLNYDRNYDTSLNDRPAGLGRNTARGFNFMSLDIRLSRTFAIGDRFRLETLVESFNTLNRTNWALPNNIIGNGIGAPLPTFGSPTAAYDPRQMQVGLRLDF